MEMEIDKVAELARVSLKEEEKKRLNKDLENIVGYVKQLSELNTEAIEPTSHVLKIENVFRKDNVKPSDAGKKVLQYAPLTEGNFFKVPKVIK